MATKLSEFLPYLLPNVPGCPEPMAEQALRSACIEFCRISLLVQDVTTDSLVANVADYTVEVPTSNVLVKVLGVWVGDKELQPASVEMVSSGLALRGPTVKETVTSNFPLVYFQKTPTSSDISLYPVPNEAYADGLAVRSAFAPSRTASSVADVLYTNWAEEIAQGALARLHAMPGLPFTNPGLAAAFSQMFAAATRRAANVARSGQLAAAARVKPASFAF